MNEAIKKELKHSIIVSKEVVSTKTGKEFIELANQITIMKALEALLNKS